MARKTSIIKHPVVVAAIVAALATVIAAYLGRESKPSEGKPTGSVNSENKTTIGGSNNTNSQTQTTIVNVSPSGASTPNKDDSQKAPVDRPPSRPSPPVLPSRPIDHQAYKIYEMRFREIAQSLHESRDPEAPSMLKEVEYYHEQNLDAIKRGEFLRSRKAVDGVNNVLDKYRKKGGNDFQPSYYNPAEKPCLSFLNDEAKYGECVKAAWQP